MINRNHHTAPDASYGNAPTSPNPDSLGLRRYCRDNGKEYEDLTQWEINTYVIKRIARK